MAVGALLELGCAFSGGARKSSIIAIVEHTSGKAPSRGTSSALPLGSGPNGKSPAEAEPRCRSADRRPETKEKAIPGAGEN